MQKRPKLFISTIVLLISVFSLQTVLAQSNSSTVMLKNRFRTNNYIQLQDSELKGALLGADNSVAEWEFIPLNDELFRIRKKGTNLYLHSESGNLECSNVPAGYWTSHWKKVPVGGKYFRIENRYREGQVLNMEKGPLVSTVEPVGYWTSHWEIIPVEVKTDNPLTDNQMKMMKKVMGKGYKAHLDYANLLTSATVPLFDYDKLPSYINIQEASTFDGRMIEGTSLKEYSNSLSASISVEGGVGLFSVGVSTTFTTNSTQKSENSFFTWNRTLSEYRMDILNPQESLLESVKYDIARLDPEALFNKYGTHYIQSAFIGGRIQFSTTIDRAEFSEDNDFEVGVKAAYGAVSGEGKFGAGNSSLTSEFTRNARVKVFGGDASLGGQIENDKTNMVAYENWRRTLKSNLSLADFADDGLRPIWELATTQARRNQLKAATQDYLIQHGNELPEPPAPRKVVKRNSKYVLISNDNRYVTRPLYKFIPLTTGSLYYPVLDANASEGNFRIAGFFGFNSTSSQPLTHGNTVQIVMKEDYLIQKIENETIVEEKDATVIGRKFLKMGGTIPHAHYWNYDAWADWTFKKVGGKAGDLIKDGDQVYIYHPGTKKYLNYYISGGTALGVDTSEKLDMGTEQGVAQKFVWTIKIVE